MARRYLSVCSGIEAASVAWEPLGWQPAAFAEIDPFACDVLAHYWPDVPNLGDVSAITEDQIRTLGPIDVVVGGTPCQDISIAGQRAGLDGVRSRLFFDLVRIFHAARSISGARWLLWENTPGAFTLNGGRDFARVVSALSGAEFLPPVDGWGNEGMALGPDGLLEWCELDAQWFGLAQRRERVFALLDSGDWRGRPPVLLESESVRGDSPPRREAGTGPAGTLTRRALDGSSPCGGDGREGLLVAATLAAYSGRHQIEQTYIPEVADPITAHEARTYTHEGRGNFRPHNVVAPAITAREAKGPCSNATSGAIIACFDETQITHPENRSTCSPVRRLTPRECERLMGFPDDFTLIYRRGKPASDTARYAALGNSIAVPKLRWIGRRIDEVAA